MDASADGLRTSPLHAEHERLRARFAGFGGWSMPLEYAGGGVLAEHAAVRGQVGVFDVSHLGKVRVTGPGAAAFVNDCLTNDLDRIGAGQAQYTLLCTEEGGVVDDLIAYRYGDDDVFLVPNASNAPAVVAVLAGAAPAGVEVRDQHAELAVVAVQGPRSDEVLSAAGLPAGHPYMSFVTAELDTAGLDDVQGPAGVRVSVCRTGYTGERGYELVVPAEAAVAVWRAVLAAGEPYGIQPAGLGARDTLRTEMGYPLHGQDISLDVTPVQAGLGWAVGWQKPRFRGREALLAEKQAGPARRLRGLRARGRGIPRPGMVLVDGDRPIGTVTSGTFSPTLRTGIALALVEAGVPLGAEVEVQVRSRREVFEVVRPPFVQPGVREG
ncbi:glycine cleavage system aminomethyltransferase GcvT [Auraticoccus sp. F435]|uniref:Aminomethyltransferase n=1 Tax=Auraticoccus cholistanensis TaxID=2656650 RepID=A0A6A9V1G6_9ACTN|nr:glycine cleavage system aminomethyltransferase GcvT [Auraticoccus cholistanensis]MVA77379.1 glycine cleavage system aminomethyltransferase GcvT [Auraticoccus cholistanensis]